MQQYETEEQQIEALKKWWKENSSSLFFGLAIGLAGIFGWRYYIDYNQQHAQQASDLFTVINQQVRLGELTDINKLEQLTTEFTGTPYAVMAAMSAASHYFDKGNTEQAVHYFQWARDNSDIEENTHLAITRLATVHISSGQLDAAESLLQQDYPAAFAARYEELRGDLYAARGDYSQARAAYDKAILGQQGNATPWLILKRDNLPAVDNQA